MICRIALASALVGAILLAPAPAQATFLPGTEPPVEYDCSAATSRAGVAGPCADALSRSVGARTELIGPALVTTRGAAVGFTGDGATTASSTATAESTQITAAGGLLRVQVEGARATQSVACGPAGNVFTGSSHVERIVINGTSYSDLTSGEYRTPFGTVLVGVSARDYYDSSFDALEGGWQTAVVVKAGLARVRVAAVGVTVYGFPC